MSKEELKAELVALVSADLAAAERVQDAAREGATHEEARPENDKDTRAIEQSYLARGQARRVEDLRAELGQAEAMVLRAFPEGAPIALGALFVALDDEREREFFMAPARGGATLSTGAVVVTPSSPVGRAVLGKTVGEEVEINAGGRKRVLEILSIR